MARQLQFRDLRVGEVFRFPSQVGYGSFFDTCEKTGQRSYVSRDTGQSYLVGSTYAEVERVQEGL